MQTKNQWKRPKDWKVVSAVAAASALGLSGLALAGPGGDRQDPGAIDLQERARVADVASVTTSTVPSTVADALRRVVESASPSPDSPFVSASPASVSPDSPATASPDTVSADSPASVSPAAVSPSPDSPASVSASPDSSSPASIESWSSSASS